MPLAVWNGGVEYRKGAFPVIASAESRLRRYMVESELAPGDRLPSESELAAGLGSSRVVVREALHALEALGLLESRPGSGWYIRGFDVAHAARTFGRSLAFHPAAVLDLLAIRRSMEADLVAGLADRLGPRELAALDELVDRMRWRAARAQRFRAEDAAFHRQIAAASGNLVALALLDLYWAVIEALDQRGFPGPDPADLTTVAEAHAQIVNALRRGDPELASRTLRASHDESQRRFSAWVEANSTAGDGAGARMVSAALHAALLWPSPTTSLGRGGEGRW